MTIREEAVVNAVWLVPLIILGLVVAGAYMAGRGDGFHAGLAAALEEAKACPSCATPAHSICFPANEPARKARR